MPTVTESMVKSRLSKSDNPEVTCTFVRKFLLFQEEGVVRISSIRTFVVQSLDVLRSGYFLAWSAYSQSDKSCNCKKETEVNRVSFS